MDNQITKVRIRRSPRLKLTQIESLSEPEILTGIEELRKHIKITGAIVRDFRKIGPLYDEKTHGELIERYQLMKQAAIYELADYNRTLGKIYRDKRSTEELSHQ